MLRVFVLFILLVVHVVTSSESLWRQDEDKSRSARYLFDEYRSIRAPLIYGYFTSTKGKHAHYYQVLLGSSIYASMAFDFITVGSESAGAVLANRLSGNTLQGSSAHASRTFDFIIVGSGSAGAVLANRLSENPKWNILLLETGKEPARLVDIPAIANLLQFTDYNWGYLTEKQENMCLGLENQRMHWPRGRALGGTTIINYMIHVRGNKLDYDNWVANGNRGWSYADVLPYFKKSEDFLVNIQDPGYHQKGGILGVQDVPYRSKSADAFVLGMQQYGYTYVDYNGANQTGVSYVHATLRRGKRSSAMEFINGARRRPNLKILTEARVTQILINPETKQAEGVEFVRNRKRYVAKSSKEVVISAGALSSPQLLMLSGIGPKEHLQELGIPLIQDLPVGKKLYDHLTFFGLVFTVNESIVLQQSMLTDPNTLLQFVLSRSGGLTTLGGVEALGFIRTPLATDSRPDVELLFLGGGLHSDAGLYYRKSFRVSDEIYNVVFKPLEGKFAFTVLPMLYHPRSFGRVELKSQNPFHWPRFYGNYFSDGENYDVRRFIASIREVQRMVKMPAFQRYDAKQVTTPIPGCTSHQYDSDDYWECALRHISATLHHQIATCKMGPASDPEAVVDDRLKVHGVKRLRVVDTSIIPEPVSAHTNVPAYMIGEKASDLIKEEWADRNS